MKNAMLFSAAACMASAALAQPVAAVTFPSLTTIYVGSGVVDSGGSANLGTATGVHCSNVSGQSASMRWQFINGEGIVINSITTTLAHGQTETVATHAVEYFSGELLLNQGGFTDGVVNVESTESGVFCSAYIVSAAVPASGMALHFVRVNAHPGTTE